MEDNQTVQANEGNPAVGLTRGMQTVWIIGAIVAVGFFLAILIISTNRASKPVQEANSAAAEPVEQVIPVDADPVAQAVAAAAAEADAAAADVMMLPPKPVMDDLEMEFRQVIELNEAICAETGQNCELAQTMRRQHEERFTGR